MKMKKSTKWNVIGCVIAVFLCIILVGCSNAIWSRLLKSLDTNSSSSDSQSTVKEIDSVKPGGWETTFPIKLSGGEVENWIVYIYVNDDEKSVSSVELIHCIGELVPGTDETALFSIVDAPIENNSFDFSLNEMVSYSINTYSGKITFTSYTEANGTISIYGNDYRFNISPLDE